MKVNSSLNKWLLTSAAVAVSCFTWCDWVLAQAQEYEAAAGEVGRESSPAGNGRLQSASMKQLEMQLRRQIQVSSPFMWRYLVELERYQRSAAPDLQQQAEAEIIEMLQRPQPLQQRLIEQQRWR